MNGPLDPAEIRDNISRLKLERRNACGLVGLKRFMMLNYLERGGTGQERRDIFLHDIKFLPQEDFNDKYQQAPEHKERG